MKPLPPLDPRPIATSVSSDLAWCCSCCSLLASISFLNCCWSCCCRSFLSCLGSVWVSDPTRSTESVGGLGERNGGNRLEVMHIWRHKRWSVSTTRPTAVYLEQMFSLCLSRAESAALGVWTSEQFCFWLRILGSSGVLLGPTTDASLSSRTRLEYRALSTEGSPSERLVCIRSRGGGGFVWRRNKIQHPKNFFWVKIKSAKSSYYVSDLFGDLVNG